MKDYFKELNIIDILGIGVPGCLLLLLLGGDQTAELLWMDQFDNHPLAFGIVLIIVGSLAGMLLQELGDMIEKGLWLIPCLDPKEAPPSGRRPAGAAADSRGRRCPECR